MVIVGRMRKINRSLHSIFLQERMEHSAWDHHHLWDEVKMKGVDVNVITTLSKWDFWWHITRKFFLWFSALPILFSVSGFFPPVGMILSMGSRKCTLPSKMTKVSPTPWDFKPQCSFKKQTTHTNETVARDIIWGSRLYLRFLTLVVPAFLYLSPCINKFLHRSPILSSWWEVDISSWML